MTDPIYRVRNWSENFENNRTRDLKKMQWVPVPNKHDGDGYTALMDHENGAAHLGAWVALLQVASKCGTRGTLLREGARPHNSRSISRITRVPEPVVQEALTRLSSDEIGWLEVVNTNETKGETPIPQEGAGIPQADVTTVRPSDYGREWTRIEGTKEVRTEPDGSGVLSPDDEPKKPKKSKPTEADRLNANHDDYPNFLDWWKLYPNKTGKQASLAKWIENGCEGNADMLPAIHQYLEIRKSKAARGDFVPEPQGPKTYLHQRAWMDYDPHLVAEAAPISDEIQSRMFKPMKPRDQTASVRSAYEVGPDGEEL